MDFATAGPTFRARPDRGANKTLAGLDFFEYSQPREEIGVLSRIPVEAMRDFFDVIDEPIPVFVAGEMYLARAEAYARQGDLANAASNLDAVLTKDDDPFGINPDTDAYSGPQTQEDIRLAIYRHRRIETFLNGTSPEAQQRCFPDFDPPAQGDSESFGRNRNY